MTKNPTTEPVQPCPNPEPCSDHPRATHETPLLLLIDTLRAENAELRRSSGVSAPATEQRVRIYDTGVKGALLDFSVQLEPTDCSSCDTLRAENAELRKRVEAAEGLLRMIVDTHDLTLPASVWKVVDAHLSTATSGGE